MRVYRLQLNIHRQLFLAITLLLLCLPAGAQQYVRGHITDMETGESIPYASVVYKGHNVAVISNLEGHYSIARHAGWSITFSAVGYQSKVVLINAATKSPLNIALQPDNTVLKEVTIKADRGKYSRKDNPAVELMKKVVAAKKLSDLSNHDYYKYDKYEKLTLAANELTPERLSQRPFSSTPWLLDQVEECQYTNKLILPISVDETVSELIYRKDPKTQKKIIKGQQSNGINDLFQTGDVLNVVLKEVFTDVNLYDDQIRLVQYPFTSPIGKDAISFYRYYIEDTVKVQRDSCIHLHFLPNNQMDFGFRGDIYILNDSSYHVRRCELTLPQQTSVNFVKSMHIEQEFEQLDNGDWVLTLDDMVTELRFAKGMEEFIIIKNNRYSGYAFDELPKKLFKGKRTEIKEPDAAMRGKSFWNEYRQVELTKSEDSMGSFVKNIKNIKGFKYFMFGLTALIENSIEIGDPNPIDLTPVNTIFSSNEFDGFRNRISATTTANLWKRWFVGGYYAHGWGSHKNYYSASLDYSFIDKIYSSWEYPKRTLRLESTYDVQTPSDRFLPTDKDNFFVTFKWAKIDKMMICNRQSLAFEYEMYGGLKTTLSLKAEEMEACGAMSFRTLNQPRLENTDIKSHHREFLRTTELHAELRYAPDEAYINNKQGRLTINRDVPIVTLGHTFGFKGFLGGQYASNVTEAKIYKRFWLNSWGKVDLFLKGGIQWNQVPYMLLIQPPANQSYVIEEEMYNLINNMEFLNDRYASMMLSWDLNGKFFNRIPLLKKLKWREYIAVNTLWGDLTNKNNPFLPENANSDRLMYFPEGCYVMDHNKPYVELVVGVHNILKIIHVDLVRRLNYLDLPTSHKWGIRYTFRLTF